MNEVLIDKLLMLRGLLQESDMEQAQSLLSELIVRAETGRMPGASMARAEQMERWLGGFLDEEHKSFLSRLDEASDDEIDVMERHLEGRRTLLELALNAGDLAEEIARTYELLGDTASEDSSAEEMLRALA